MQCDCGCAFLSYPNQQFTPLKRCRENGPGVTTRLLIEGIVQSNSLGSSVLDIGAGVGSLSRNDD